jgi:hypothetical protein
MEPRTSADAWRWALASAPGIGMISVAVQAGWIAYLILMALPHRAYPVLGYGGLVSVEILVTVVAQGRRRAAKEPMHLRTPL